MRSARLLLFLLAVAISVLSGFIITVQATARVAIPDRLEIMRTIGFSHTPAHEMVTQARPVQDLYHIMLALPIAPADEICPQYIMANYHLTFYSHNAVVQKADALRGLCQPVTLGSSDVRTANAKFWSLMNKAIVVGKPLSTPVGTPTATPMGTPASLTIKTPTFASVGTPTSTPVKTPTSTLIGTPTLHVTGHK